MKKQEKVKAFRRHHNTRVIKSKQTYSTQEIADLLSVHPNTVGIWHKTGLPRIDDQQPFLVFGQDLIDFIKTKNNSKKHPCAPNELFCCKCQQPRKPKDNIVRIKADECRTNITGICEICGTKMYKTISPQRVEEYKNIFIIQTAHKKNLIECTNTCAIVETQEVIKYEEI